MPTIKPAAVQTSAWEMPPANIMVRMGLASLSAMWPNELRMPTTVPMRPSNGASTPTSMM